LIRREGIWEKILRKKSRPAAKGGEREGKGVIR
jgi:hypothetical protein